MVAAGVRRDAKRGDADSGSKSFVRDLKPNGSVN